MGFDTESTSAYTNRRPQDRRAADQARLPTPRRHTTGRAVDRMFLALRAYEQRAQQRTTFGAWLIARATGDGTRFDVGAQASGSST